MGSSSCAGVPSHEGGWTVLQVPWCRAMKRLWALDSCPRCDAA